MDSIKRGNNTPYTNSETLDGYSRIEKHSRAGERQLRYSKERGLSMRCLCGAY